MSSLFENWRRHLWLWVLPLAFVVLNLLGVTFYRTAFAGQVERLEKRYLAADDNLKRIQNEIVVVREFLGRAESHREQTRLLHSERFQTEEQGFTRTIQAVKKLARDAGLQPASLSYPRKGLTGHDLVQRSISFSVKGSYDQLRNFINFLELSEHFITLNSVTLGGGGKEQRNPSLSIKLVMSTIFTTLPPPPASSAGTGVPLPSEGAES